MHMTFLSTCFIWPPKRREYMFLIPCSCTVVNSGTVFSLSSKTETCNVQIAFKCTKIVYGWTYTTRGLCRTIWLEWQDKLIVNLPLIDF